MSKNTSSEIKLTPTAPAALPALKGLNLQVFVMIAAIVVIMLFFTWVTDGAYLSARNISNLLRQTAITGILAVGMVFVIISAEIDLSVGVRSGDLVLHRRRRPPGHYRGDCAGRNLAAQ